MIGAKLVFHLITAAFNRNEDLKVPYFDLFTGEFMGKSVALEHEFFNVPLRRDLVHRAYIYYLKYDMRFDWAAKTMEDVTIACD